MALTLLAVLTLFAGMLIANSYETWEGADDPTRGAVVMIGGGIAIALVLLSFARNYVNALWFAALVLTVTWVGTLLSDVGS